jgi:hypothetical protein
MRTIFAVNTNSPWYRQEGKISASWTNPLSETSTLFVVCWRFRKIAFQEPTKHTEQPGVANQLQIEYTTGLVVYQPEFAEMPVPEAELPISAAEVSETIIE